MTSGYRHVEHPLWCRRAENGTGMARHRSNEVTVGRYRPGHFEDRGLVKAWLTATADGPVWLTMNCSHLTGVTTDLDLDDAVRLRDGLSDLLRQAGRE